MNVLSATLLTIHYTVRAVCYLPTPLCRAVLEVEWPVDTPLRVLYTGGEALIGKDFKVCAGSRWLAVGLFVAVFVPLDIYNDTRYPTAALSF